MNLPNASPRSSLLLLAGKFPQVLFHYPHLASLPLLPFPTLLSYVFFLSYMFLLIKIVDLLAFLMPKVLVGEGNLWPTLQHVAVDSLSCCS